MALGRPRAFDRDAVLDRALEVFWRAGYEGASLSDLTAAMGINRPSLYAAFGDKAGLFRAALDRYVSGPAHYAMAALDAPSAVETVRRLLYGAADAATGGCGPLGCLLVRASLAGGPDAAEARAEACARQGLLATGLEARLARAVAAGELSAGTDPAAVARFVLTVMNGLAVEGAKGVTTEQLRKVADTAVQAVEAQRT